MADISVVDAYRLVQKVRSETNISHELSCRAVVAVLDELLPLIPNSVSCYIRNIGKYFDEPLEAPDVLIDDNEDMRRLLTLSNALSAVKNDSQQRSWELFEDETVIMEYLSEFNIIMKDADPAITRNFLIKIDFSIVNCLAEYYQMETRWSIRKLLLETFTRMCCVHRTACIELFNSVLPLELSRDIQSTNDMGRLLMSINVLSEVLFIGEPIPVTYLDIIGKVFISHLLDLIEREIDEELNVQELLVKFIIMYNYTFPIDNDRHDNIALSALLEHANPKMFTQTLLLIFNRGDDPVKSYKYIPAVSNSLIKLMIDLFSRKETISIFYKNDVEVFVDIVVRQLINISRDDKERNELLRLVHLILLHCEADEFIDHIRDLQYCFDRILDEESSGNNDKILVRDIVQNFPHLFTS